MIQPLAIFTMWHGFYTVQPTSLDQVHELPWLCFEIRRSISMLTNTRGPALAQELCDAIIDQAYYEECATSAVCVQRRDHDIDRRRLMGVCSLVCKSWLPRSRSHCLFGRVYLSTPLSKSNTKTRQFLDR